MSSLESQLHIGNIDPQTTLEVLYELIVQFAPVQSLKMPRDRITRQHQGFAFAEFENQKDAAYVLNIVDGLMLYGRPLHVHKTLPPGAKYDEDFGPVVFVGNLDSLVDEKLLVQTFKAFGKMKRLPKLAMTSDGTKAHAFLYYETFEASDKAIEKMSGRTIMNRQVLIDYAFKRGSTEKHGDEVERLLYKKAKENGYVGT